MDNFIFLGERSLGGVERVIEKVVMMMRGGAERETDI